MAGSSPPATRAEGGAEVIDAAASLRCFRATRAVARTARANSGADSMVCRASSSTARARVRERGYGYPRLRVLPLAASVIARKAPSPSTMVCEVTRLIAVPPSSRGSVPKCQLGPYSGSRGRHARSRSHALTSARGRGASAMSRSSGPRETTHRSRAKGNGDRSTCRPSNPYPRFRWNRRNPSIFTGPLYIQLTCTSAP